MFRGRLEMEPDQAGPESRLRAHLPTRALDTTSVMQERVLRTIASRAWQGELRVNPAWTTLGRRLTVHSQGGCPMGPDHTTGVTDEWGEVYHRKGLFVMDAAAFPTSVGVNPSATIAAVAEYKIEHFIRSNKNRPQPTWQAAEKAGATKWVDLRRDDLDPLNRRDFQLNAEPAPKSLGLGFNETMTGFFERYDPPREPTDLETIVDLDAEFRGAEDKGIEHGDNRRPADRGATDDLARLVAAEMASKHRMTLKAGSSTPGLWRAGPPAVELRHPQLFARPPDKTIAPGISARVNFTADGQATEPSGLLLRNSPGSTPGDTLTIVARGDGRGSRVPSGSASSAESPAPPVRGLSWALASSISSAQPLVWCPGEQR